jgi:type VI secretion system protein ImpJ
MRQMQSVLWTKGVLLSPQHLQTQDRFLEDLLGFYLSALSFSPWGFSRLEIDREALSGGSLALSAAAGIFPDGMPFEMPAADPPPPPRQLEDGFEPDQETLDVYLAIPEHRLGGHNVSTTRGEQNARYVAEVALRRDENTGLNEKPIQLARKNFRLLVEGESSEGHSVLRVARVRRSEAGTFLLDGRFVPPLIDLTASEFLLSIARRLVEILAAKSTTLAGMRRQRNQSLADFGVSDVANFWLLYTVNTYFPRFRHLYETRRGHPGELYSAMLALAGALTTFSTQVHPRDLPSYDHLELGDCFGRLDELLRDLLEAVVPATHVSLPLTKGTGAVYATSIEQDRYLSAPQIFLALNAGVKQDELLRRVPQLVKVSSGDRIEHLIRQALPGVALHHVPNPPNALPVKLNYQYFLRDRSGPDWDAIRVVRNIAVYVPQELPDPQLEIVIVLPPKE